VVAQASAPASSAILMHFMDGFSFVAPTEIGHGNATMEPQRTALRPRHQQ
jgi:hypothetical protein